VGAVKRPAADDVDEGFGEDDAAAGQVAQLEVGGRVLGDLLEEAGREAKEMVVDARADDGEGVVHVGEGEEGFAFAVGGGEVGRVEGGGVVVEDAEEIVIVAEGGAGGGSCVLVLVVVG